MSERPEGWRSEYLANLTDHDIAKMAAFELSLIRKGCEGVTAPVCGEAISRLLRTDPEPDDPEGLVEEDPLEALELTDAEKADLYYRRWQGLREAAEAVCDFPMHDDDSPLAEAVRALRDRLQADQGADDGAD